MVTREGLTSLLKHAASKSLKCGRAVDVDAPGWEGYTLQARKMPLNGVPQVFPATQVVVRNKATGDNVWVLTLGHVFGAAAQVVKAGQETGYYGPVQSERVR